MATWIWFVLAGTLLGAAIAGAVSVFAPSPYTARVTILATPTPTTDAVTNNDIQTAQAYLPTLAELATIRQILDQVIAKTGAPTTADLLAENVNTHVPVATNLLEISVSDPDPAMAAALANAIAAELSSYLPPGSTTGTVHLDLTVVDPATPPTSRDGPGLALRIALGAAIALFLTVTIAFLIENLRQVRNTEDPTPTPPSDPAWPTEPPDDRMPASQPRGWVSSAPPAAPPTVTAAATTSGYAGASRPPMAVPSQPGAGASDSSMQSAGSFGSLSTPSSTAIRPTASTGPSLAASAGPGASSASSRPAPGGGTASAGDPEPLPSWATRSTIPWPSASAVAAPTVVPSARVSAPPAGESAHVTSGPPRLTSTPATSAGTVPPATATTTSPGPSTNVAGAQAAATASPDAPKAGSSDASTGATSNAPAKPSRKGSRRRAPDPAPGT